MNATTTQEGATGMEMEHAYADVNGIRMHYVAHGKGEPILFLHGFPEYWGVWKHIMQEFAKDHRVIAPDLRGYNLTSRPANVEQYRIQHLVEDLRAFVEYLGLKKLTVVSEDWGALVGWSFALRHPEYIRRFVTIDITHPALFNRELRENPQQQQASAYMLAIRDPNFAAQLSADDFAFTKGFVFADARAHGAVISPEDEAEWVQTWKLPGALDAGLNYYRAAQMGPPDGKGAPGGSNLLDDLPEQKWKVHFPVLVLWGEEDQYLLQGGLVGLEKLVHDLTIHKLPGASHWVTVEKPAQVIQHVRDFITHKGR